MNPTMWCCQEQLQPNKWKDTLRRMTCQKIARADELPLALTYDSWTANTNKQKLASLLSVIFLLVQQQNEMRKYWCAPLPETLVRQPRRNRGDVHAGAQ